MLWLRRLVEWVGRTITPRRADTVLAALLTAAAVIEAMVTVVATDRQPWVLTLAAAPVATLAVAWRRRTPVPATVAGMVAFLVASGSGLLVNGQSLDNQVPVFAGIASIILLYSAIRYGEGWARPVVWAASLAGVVVDELARATGVPYASIASSWVFLSALAAAAQALRYRADLREEREEQARTGEREQLARELHDAVAHHVSAMVVQATAALAVIEKQPDAAEPALRFIKASGQETIGEMRRMVGILRGAEAAARAPQRGIAGLDDLYVEFPGAAPIRFHAHGVERAVDVALGQSVHRIVQEAVTNARRHARGAAVVDVTLLWEPTHLEVEVVDDGDPVPAKTPTGGFGLVGMAERARLLDGTFAAGPRPGGGWRVHCRLPIPPADGPAPPAATPAPDRRPAPPLSATGTDAP